MKARVYVTLKPSVFDPQGRVVAEALHTLGYGEVQRRAPGQVLRGRPRRRRSRRRPQARVAEMAAKLLANPVIESYRVEVL